MSRQIVHGLMFALVVSLGFGCGDKKRGVQIEQVEQEENQKAPTMAQRVDTLTGILLSAESEENERQLAAQAAGRLAADPNLTADQRAKFVQALEKMLETEKGERVIERGKEALEKLKQ